MIKNKYGIHYPFTCLNDENYYIDLNNNQSDELLSEIIHVILTPKGQRVRMPNFGTNLIKYIYEPNDDQSWDNIKNEIINSVSSFVPNAKLNDINILKDKNDDNKLSLLLNYSVNNGPIIENKETIVQL